MRKCCSLLRATIESWCKLINFDFERHCYSCTACYHVCPKDAIHFNEEFFPEIDNRKCIDCGLCEKVCINVNEKEYDEKIDYAKSYVARNLDLDIRKKSSSGGIFYLLAKKTIENGGFVCGCVYDEHFMPKHVMTDDLDVVKCMMGSKYVMSELDNIIAQVKKALNTGKTVLFSGVPCQIQALMNCIEDRSNLILVGVVCHGSMNRKIWKKFITEEAGERSIKYVSMRDKRRGWLNYGLNFVFTDGSESLTFRKEDGYFLKCFTDGLFERECCLECKYKGTAIGADILLGDAWGMDQLFPELSDQWGLSAVICLSEKGIELFHTISDSVELNSVETEEIIRRNQRIVTPPAENPLRKKFLQEIKKGNLHATCRKYAAPQFPLNIYMRARRIINVLCRR